MPNNQAWLLTLREFEGHYVKLVSSCFANKMVLQTLQWSRRVSSICCWALHNRLLSAAQSSAERCTIVCWALHNRLLNAAEPDRSPARDRLTINLATVISIKNQLPPNFLMQNWISGRHSHVFNISWSSRFLRTNNAPSQTKCWTNSVSWATQINAFAPSGIRKTKYSCTYS